MNNTSYVEMTDVEYNQFLKEFYKENGPKPSYCLEFDDFVEDELFNLEDM